MSDPKGKVAVFGWEIDLKYISLVLLIAQNVILVLSIKYSRMHVASDGMPYLISTVVVVSEVVKFTASLGLEFVLETKPGESFVGKMYDEFFSMDTVKLAVPGVLYVIQNNLLFVALSNLSVAVYQVSAQLKILTTAMFAVVMLGKRLSRYQMMSLLILTMGVGIVQVAKTDDGGNQADNAGNQIKGMAAILVACVSSGFAGIYFEKILKHGKQVSLYVRNFQLAFFGYTIGIITVFMTDRDAVATHGFFQGYSPMVWAIVFTQACGGLLVAVVMKYADNILKGFATSVSIVLASAISWVLFDAPLNALFVLGAMLVMCAVYIYGKYPPQVISSPPKPIFEDEELRLMQQQEQQPSSSKRIVINNR